MVSGWILWLSGGETSFSRSHFISSIATPYTAIVIDELNRAEPDTQNKIMSLSDIHQRMTLELAEGDDRIVPRAPNTVIIATANIGSEYSGTHRIDPAMADRLMRVQMDFPESELDLLLRKNVSQDDASTLLQVARALRDQYTQGAVGDFLTTRGLLRAGELVTEGFELEDAVLVNLHVYDDASVAAVVAVMRAVL
jgi:MoxR-like ATPase